MTRITPNTAAGQRTVLAVRDRLATVPVDQVIAHTELQRLIPNHLLTLYYVFVQRAQRMLNAENGAVFATVRGEGYRRLTNSTGAEYSANTALLRIRSQSRKGQKVATMAIRFANDISNTDKRRIYQKVASLGLIEHLTMAKTVQIMPDEPVPVTKPADPLAGLRDMLDQVDSVTA